LDGRYGLEGHTREVAQIAPGLPQGQLESQVEGSRKAFDDIRDNNHMMSMMYCTQRERKLRDYSPLFSVRRPCVKKHDERFR